MDEGSDLSSDSCQTAHNIHNTELYVTSDGFETAIPGCKCSQTHVLEQLEMETQNADPILRVANGRDVSVHRACVCVL